MTIDAANALFRYFESLYSLNQNLIILCGVDILDHKVDYEQRIDEIMMTIPRLLPYVHNKKTQSYEISPKDGLMNFSTDIPFLSADYDIIFQKHTDFLIKAKKVRNKLEHEMHGARIIASMSSNASLFTVTYEVTEKLADIKANEIISFVKDMNVLFAKIQTLVDQFAASNGKEDHPYYHRLVRYSFTEFNKIYESNLLRTFGQALLPF